MKSFINISVIGAGLMGHGIALKFAQFGKSITVHDTNLENLNSNKIINMKENQGHARCNATGLKHIFENEEFDYVIPMDGDGEDRPEAVSYTHLTLPTIYSV